MSNRKKDGVTTRVCIECGRMSDGSEEGVTIRRLDTGKIEWTCAACDANAGNGLQIDRLFGGRQGRVTIRDDGERSSLTDAHPGRGKKKT